MAQRDRAIQCATYLRQLNHMRKALIGQYAKEEGRDETLVLAIDHIASAILTLGGTVFGVAGFDCYEPPLDERKTLADVYAEQSEESEGESDL